MMNDNGKTLLELKEEFPSYNIRVYVGGLYITALWTDFSKDELERFRGRAYVDHSCNEIALSEKD
jgi:hypothetical protein